MIDLAVEWGYQTDGAETTPQGASVIGKGLTADCAEDNTATTNCAPWIEFSNTFTEVQDPVLHAYNLINDGSTVDANSFATASVAPPADHLILMTVANTHGTAATLPTVTGASMTWDQVDTVTNAAGLNRVTLFRAMAASPGSGVLTIDFGGVTQTACSWNVTWVAGAQTGANGANAIVQSVDNTAASATSLTVTLAAFGSSNNVAYGAIMHAANELSTTGSGLNFVGERTLGTPATSVMNSLVAQRHHVRHVMGDECDQPRHCRRDQAKRSGSGRSPRHYHGGPGS